jgi:hypothetical protein
MERLCRNASQTYLPVGQARIFKQEVADMSGKVIKYILKTNNFN